MSGVRWFKGFNGQRVDCVYDDSTPSITDKIKRRVDTAYRTFAQWKLIASAVNWLTFQNSATGNSPTISVAGSDTNIDLTLAGKGTGKVVLGSALDITGAIVLSGDVAVNGGDMTSTATTFNLFNSTVTTANLFGAGTTIGIGAATGTLTLKNATVVADGTLKATGGLIGDLTAKPTSNLAINSVAGYDVVVKMGDNAGAKKLSFVDSDAAEVASIDSNGVLSATGFKGPLTGNVTGSVTGNAGTATIASTVSNGAITSAKLATGMIYPVAVEDAKTTSVEENIAGLSSAIALATEIRADFISHAANATRHTTGQQSTAGIAAIPTDLATLCTLTDSLTSLYAAHNADAVLGSGWAYHDAQAAAKALAAETAVTTLAGAITRLNDIKAKYNDHEDETTGHNTQASVVADQVATADAANGAAIRVTVAGATATCLVQWSIINDGTGDVTGVSAVAGAGYVDFTFSADPQGDSIISYTVFEVAA